MKKVYHKPEIYFDSFVMCTDIAGTCTYATNTPARGTCGLYYSDTITIFATGVSACTFQVGSSPVDAEYNGICFHVPAGTRTLFNS